MTAYMKTTREVKLGTGRVWWSTLVIPASGGNMIKSSVQAWRPEFNPGNTIRDAEHPPESSSF